MIDSKTKAKIVRHTRLLFRQAPQVQEALVLSVHPTIKGPRGGKRFTCACCKSAFPGSGVQIDHIDPVVPEGMMQKNMTIDEYAARLYCDVSNLQVLCEACHKEKTNSEKKKKREAKCGLKTGS